MEKEIGTARNSKINVNPDLASRKISAKAIRLYDGRLNLNSSIERGEDPTLFTKLTYCPKRKTNEIEIVFMGNSHVENIVKDPALWSSFGHLVLSPEQGLELGRFITKISELALKNRSKLISYIQNFELFSIDCPHRREGICVYHESAPGECKAEMCPEFQIKTCLEKRPCRLEKKDDQITSNIQPIGHDFACAPIQHLIFLDHRLTLRNAGPRGCGEDQKKKPRWSE